MKLGLGLIVALVLAGPAAAAPAPAAGYNRVEAPPKRPDGLRGSRPEAAAIAAPPALPSRQRDPALVPPGLLYPATPRITGWSGPDTAAGGARCRTACANDQYRCVALDGGDCSEAWAKCVVACPEAAAGPL